MQILTSARSSLWESLNPNLFSQAVSILPIQFRLGKVCGICTLNLSAAACGGFSKKQLLVNKSNELEIGSNLCGKKH